MERRWDLGRVVGWAVGWASAHQFCQTNSSNPANSTASRVFGKPSGFGGFGFWRGLAEWLVWVGGNGWIGGGGWIGGLQPTLQPTLRTYASPYVPPDASAPRPSCGFWRRRELYPPQSKG
ncbi:TPA: hypothetical protein WGO19_000995 [Neisseria meningitidis]